MKIYIFHAEAGYGHRKIAEIIRDEILTRHSGDTEVILEDALASTPGLFRRGYPALYFYSVKYTPGIWGWGYETLDKPLPYRLVQPLRTAVNRLVASRLLTRMIAEQPEVIICTHFLSAELFARAKREGRLKSRLITVVTDFFPHNFWVSAGTDTYWVMAEEGRRDLVRRGIPEDAVIPGGIPVSPAFLPRPETRTEILAKHGMSPERFTLLMTSGSFGLGPTREILERLSEFSERIQVFVVCGNNRALHQQLEAARWAFPLKSFGFIDFMPDLMEASDLMIAKAGGSTTCESLVKGIPMVILKPIPGQETRNARLLRERNASFFLEQPEQITVILNSIFEHPHLLKEKLAIIAGLAKPLAGADLVRFIVSGERPAT